MRLCVAAAIAVSTAATALAQPAATSLPIYSADTIREREPEFRSVIIGNYERLMRPTLNPAEARKLRAVRWSFPTNEQQVLFEFYANSAGNGTITMPVASLLLLKDLATAEAWLTVNGYSTFSLLDYVTIVRLNRLAQWPASDRLPARALGIPEDALNDERVRARRDGTLNTTILFIVAHELGHLLHGLDAQARCAQNRGQCDYRALQASETRADAFAIELFRRMGLVPSSSNLFFALTSRLQPLPSEFADTTSWRRNIAARTHPNDAQRIAAAANLIERDRASFATGFANPPDAMPQITALVRDLRKLSESLEDRGVSALQLAWAKTMLPADLQPRKTLLPSLRVTAADRAKRGAFAGHYRGKLAQANGLSQELEILFRTGAGGTIVGEAMVNGIRGRIEGQLASTAVLAGTIDIGGDIYDVRLETSRDGAVIRGNYGSREQPSVKGSLNLQRNGRVVM